MIKTLLLVNLLLRLSLGVDDFCTSFWKGLQDDSISSIEKTNFFKYSQKSANYEKEFSHVANCKEEPEMDSFSLLVLSNDILESYQACLPKECAPFGDEEAWKITSALNWNLNRDNLLIKSFDSNIEVGFSNMLVGMMFLAYVCLVLFFTISKNMKNGGSYNELSPQRQHFQRRWEIFNLKTNMLSLWEKPKDTRLAGFNFLKVLASYWVVGFHTFLVMSSFGYFINEKDLNRLEAGLTELARSGGLIVEYFFMMTGFLAAYSLVPKISKKKDSLNLSFILGIIKHRWLRIAPLLFCTYIFYYQIGPLLSDSPVWPWFEFKTTQCEGKWWATLLLNGDSSKRKASAIIDCMGQIWYIPVDFVLYIVAILVICVYAKNRKYGIFTTIGVILFSFIYRISSLSLVLNPHIRWLNYVVRTPNFAHSCFSGLLWGLYYHEYRNSKQNNIFSRFEKMNSLKAYGVFLLGLGVNLTVLLWWDIVSSWLPQIGIWGTVAVNLYVNSMALCLMVLTTQGNLLLQKFVSLRIFHILGKTSYSFYLLNDLFLWIGCLNSLLTSNDFSFGNIAMSICKAILLTQIAAIVWFLFLEKPLSALNFSRPSRQKAAQTIQTSKDDSVLKIESPSTSKDNSSNN